MTRASGPFLYTCAAVLGLTAINASAAVITLDFEGIRGTYPDESTIQILDYYDGGSASNGRSGPNLGVAFTADALALCLNTGNTPDTQCSNTSRGGLGIPTSRLTAMYFEFNNPTMNVAAGFDTGFAMAYANPINRELSIEIWSGLNASGTLLASLALSGTPNAGCPIEVAGDNPFESGLQPATYCPFADTSVAFAGIAQSVRFTGIANQSVYDDFTFGSTTVGGGPQVPEPSTLALLGIGLMGIALTRRRRIDA
jgi:hypothetical protein